MQAIWTKYKRMSIQAKSAIWFAMCSILQKGISLITVPIFTRLLTSEQYGIYSLYLSWFQILTVITSLNLYHGVFNNGMTKFDKDRDKYISAMQGLTLTLTAGAFIVYLVTHKIWSELLGLTQVLILLMFIELAVAPAISFWFGRQRFEFRYKRLVYVTLTKSVANPVLGLIMVWLAQDKSMARVASVVITEVVFSGSLMILQFLRGKCFVHRRYWKYALKLAIPLLPHYLSGIILNQGDRIMIGHMVGKEEVAFYSVAYNIGMLVQIVTTSINNSFTPWMYQSIKEDNCSGIKRSVNLLLVAIAVATICLMLCSPELILIFGSEKYARAAYVIPPVAASVFFIFLYNILAIPQFYFEQMKFLAVSSVVAAGANIILNYIFIKMYGFIAAGYTTLACYILYGLGHYCMSRRVLNKFFARKPLYDGKFILAISSGVIFIGVGCNFLFDFRFIRYGVLVLFFVLAYVKRHEIINLTQGMQKK